MPTGLLKWISTGLPNLSSQARAIITVIGIGIVTVSLGAAAAFTTYAYPPMIALGAFYGVILSYPVTRFLRPRIQSIVTAFLGGLTAGNIGSEQAKLSSAIVSISKWVKDQVVALHPGASPEATHLNGAITWGIWTCILIALAILAANAYFANHDQNDIGTRVGAAVATMPSPATTLVPPAASVPAQSVVPPENQQAV